MSTDREIVIIGAGPAGLATAIGLRRSGHEVVVLDRQRPPIDKACGEGLMPDGVRILQEIGVLTGAELGVPFHGIRYVDETLRAEARFRAGFGLGVRRTTLQQAMVDRAREVGVEMIFECVVRGLDHQEVVTDRGVFCCRWIVGADGLHSRVRKWAGLGSDAVRFRRFGVRRHYAASPWTDLVEVHWARRCEAYVTPVSDDEVGVAFLWSGFKSDFAGLLARFPELTGRLSGASVVSTDQGAAQLEQRTRGLYRGHIALVGDAAGYRDAITGEGVSMALHQATALAGAIDKEDLREYERAARRLERLPNALIRILLEIEARPRIRRRLIHTLAADPALFERLLSIHAREASPYSLKPGGLARLARGLLH
jgi:flavin-dependent dehydrogenase